MKIYKSVLELIGGTPLVELGKLAATDKLYGKILAKVESFNTAGSVKDRVALEMVEEAEKDGRLQKNSVIIEPTSGNTGIGLAAVCAIKGYRLIIVMPDTMSAERRKLMKAYGAELVLTDGKKGMRGAIEEAEKINSQLPGSIIAGQFVNPANPLAHRKSTGPEILRDTDGKVDFFVAGVGTGGTVTGVGQYLKSKIGSVKIIAVEPEKSPVLSKGVSGSHGLQGIGAGFVPDVLDTGVYDEIMTVNEEQAFHASRLLAKKEGILAGISSGAALYAAMKIAGRSENEGKNIVVLLPDTGDRYLSTELFSE